MFNNSIAFSKSSNGIFDPTIAPLIKLWARGAIIKRVPPPEMIKDTLSLVDYKQINVEGNRVFLSKKGMCADFGGIAKGSIIDRMVEMLKNHGAENGLVNAGGDIRVFGEKEWQIGIQHPRKERDVLLTLKLKNQSIATSGDYQRFYMVGEKRYHHILDPRTGYPADKSMSATVITPKATDADALATIAFILGPEKGIEMLEQLEDTEGIIVDASGKIFTTSALKSLVEKIGDRIN